jgi:stage II sporulation protein D
MIHREPILRVGGLEGYARIQGSLNGIFTDNAGVRFTGAWIACVGGGEVILCSENGEEWLRGSRIHLHPVGEAHCVLYDVTIGVKFHWERKEAQSFSGGLEIVARIDGTLTAINHVALEHYLESVISSEMSAAAPIELLKAHAITSRSWLVAMLERSKTVLAPATPIRPISPDATEVLRWYSREDHDLFDVCADDHCQRYQGTTKIISATVRRAVEDTRGMFLVYGDTVCDARFYKACGGLTDNFENSWEDVHIPYLQSVSCSHRGYPAIHTEQEMEQWVMASPEAFCNTRDTEVLRQILPSFDQETTDFFRWKITYPRETVEEIIRSKSGVDFGTLMDLQPVQRGPSGRLVKLRVVGTRRTLTIGKDLEIRRWLSPSHLYSSAFVVSADRGSDRIPRNITLTGAGWGHGVGLCQIGAAIMAAQGWEASGICRHYFSGAGIHKLY